MAMARIVCLANSMRPDGRCVAGIDIETKKWIRPVSKPSGGVPVRKVFINGKELAILDVVDIPFANVCLQDKYQRENRIIDTGDWKIIDQVKPEYLLDLCEDDLTILHNHEDCITSEELEKLPFCKWKSLQLVHLENVNFHKDSWDPRRWRVHFHNRGKHYFALKLTDHVITDKLAKGEKVSKDCFLTISLAGPWRPSGDESQPERCYKLVAGVVELKC